MILSVEAQMYFFLMTVALGGILGFAYDCLRILRHAISHKGFWVQVEDGIYWICATFFSFWVILQRNSGEMRFFVILGLFGGMILYFCGVSHKVRLVGNGILTILWKSIRLILKIVCTPFRLIYLLVRIPLRKIGGFCVRKHKKCLCFCVNYVKIKATRVKRDWKAFANRANHLGVKENGKNKSTKQKPIKQKPTK